MSFRRRFLVPRRGARPRLAWTSPRARPMMTDTMIDDDLLERIRVAPGTEVRLAHHHTGWAQDERLEELGANR